ncbi:hypothetical protein ACEWN4_002098 [Serratia marcescens]
MIQLEINMICGHAVKPVVIEMMETAAARRTSNLFIASILLRSLPMMSLSAVSLQIGFTDQLSVIDRFARSFRHIHNPFFQTLPLKCCKIRKVHSNGGENACNEGLLS